ncbi:MAG: type III pantothenate kinase [Bernardetiaceae bacterium]
MLLAVDIGNSNIVYGVFDGQKWSHQWREETSIQRSLPEEESVLRSSFLECRLGIDQIGFVVLSSVVPERSPAIEQVLRRLFGERVLVINERVYPHLPLQIRNPHEIGTDLVANAVAGYARFSGALCTIVDFGTALTFTTISPRGKILGVSIAPGLKTAIRALSMNTAKLPEVPLAYPESAMGQNTVHAIQSGILVGYTGLVKYTLQRIKLEVAQPGITHHVLATGGLSSILTPLREEFDAIDALLTLDGLRLIANYYLDGQPDDY